MLNSTIVILPAAEAHWEVWRCGRECVWQGSIEDLSQDCAGRSNVTIALPARSCRTFAFFVPTEDRQLVRKLAFAQLEKRGLTTGGVEQTPFDCHVLHQGDGRSIVSVDVLSPEAAVNVTSSRAKAVMPSARLFAMPAGKLVVMEEQRRLVLCAGLHGRLLHSQIVSVTRDLNGHGAEEIRIASLALQQQGVLNEIIGIELWGDFSATEAKDLSNKLDLPVEVKARPSPERSALRRESSIRLLPPSLRQAQRHRRRRILPWAALIALLLPLVWWLWDQHRELTTIESEAVRMEQALDMPSANGSPARDNDKVRAEHDLVAGAQSRWAALRMALEPRRYPIAHLNNLTRILSTVDVVLTRYESKAAEIAVSGTARSSMDAYRYFSSVNKDVPLGVFAWSMTQPAIGADGSASFEMKGKMR